MYTEPTYRENPTDKGQSVIEEQQFEGGIPVFDNDKTKEVVKANGGAECTQHGVSAQVNLGHNAGVVMSHDDKPNSFVCETIGKP